MAINWLLNQLDMLLFIKIKFENNRSAQKIFSQGGTKVFGMGETGLEGGGLPLHGGVPPIPPHIGQPWYGPLIAQKIV